MPYLPTSQAFLEQSSLLLEAYPEDTRITTKYSFPPHLPRSTKTKKSSSKTAAAANGSTTEAPSDSQTATSTPATTAPIATLTLKTYNPVTGICLKYRTNKAAEVGRLISGLGKLASGAKVSDVITTTTATADVEMTDAPAVVGEEVGGEAAVAGKADAVAVAAGGKGGKAKKKSGKGKR